MVTQAVATETAVIEVQFTSGHNSMNDVAYLSPIAGLTLADAHIPGSRPLRKPMDQSST
jgi:hypothetical protein